MLHQLLPPTVDNTYRGHPAALWLFGVLVFLKLVISVNSMVNGHSVASGADGMPLDTFATGAAQTVVSLFGLLGIATLILCVICIVVLVRYRALIPFMYAMLLLEFLARKLFLQAMPIPRVGASTGFHVTLVLLVLMLAGLALSLMKRPAAARAT